MAWMEYQQDGLRTYFLMTLTGRRPNQAASPGDCTKHYQHFGSAMSLALLSSPRQRSADD
jgi:hypothetical protein